MPGIMAALCFLLIKGALGVAVSAPGLLDKRQNQFSSISRTVPSTSAPTSSSTSQPFPPPSDSARRGETQQNLGLVIGLYVASVAIISFGLLRTLLIDFRDRMFTRHAHRHPSMTSTTRGKRKPSMFSRMVARAQAHVTLPALFGGRHVATVGGIATLPTRFQAVLVGLFGLVMLIMAVVDFRGKVDDEGRRWHGTNKTRYIGVRTGYLSLGLLPIVLLLSGKTTFMQKVTGWSGSAIGVFHRWIARACVLLAIVHSACFAYIKADFNNRGEDGGFIKAYYEAGTIATVIMGCLVFFSLLPFRQRFYDLFIASHITLTIFCLGFLWKHLAVSPSVKSIRAYVYTCIAIYISQRILRLLNLFTVNHTHKKHPARIVCIRGTDVLKLTVYPHDPVHFFAGCHYYVYMKGFHYRLYESHPFTAVSYRPTTKPNSRSPSGGAAKLTFLIKPQAGLTRHFTSLLDSQPKTSSGQIVTKADINVMIEGPYGTKHPVMTYKTILLIAGGIGISAVLPHIRDYFTQMSTPEGRRGIRTRRIVLLWSCRGYEFFRKIWRREILPILKDFEKNCVFGEEGGDVKAMLKTFEPHFYVSSGDGETEMGRMASTTMAPKAGQRSRNGSVSTTGGNSSKAMSRSDSARTTNTVNSSSSNTHPGRPKRPSMSRGVSSSTYAPSTSLVPFTLSYERCDIAKFMEGEFDRTLGKWGSDGRQLAVVVCGPGRFVDDVRRYTVVQIKRDVDEEKENPTPKPVATGEEERRKDKKAKKRERQGSHASQENDDAMIREEDENGPRAPEPAATRDGRRNRPKREEMERDRRKLVDVEVIVNGRKEIKQVEVGPKSETVVRCGVGYFEESFG
ncbi:hypothetical protein BJ508DRAFT_3302 [Ascobolus immersus RN42]|uniref:FAD-binding FR-type domain-containing protein n=1 Tax=Ascobolus immersus RN42 TaxID=1160509 RepID=A0A3N4IVB9_ASCIM|nr:hypothetical protein BJ508DRAFT_3302 [Ascobolus immersus RN42]